MIRVVLDTNIIISGIFWDRLPEQIYQLAQTKYILVTSVALCEELRDVLNRAKFARIFTVIGKTSEQVYVAYLKSAEQVVSVDIADNPVRDKDDLPILACAIGGKADYIVTGDNDLLALEGRAYKGVKIVTPIQFDEILKHLDE